MRQVLESLSGEAPEAGDSRRSSPEARSTQHHQEHSMKSLTYLTLDQLAE
jgi:hypothetical protein